MMEHKSHYFRFVTISDEDDQCRLSRWFKRHYPGLPHSFIEKALRKGQIRVDGKRASASTQLMRGQNIKLPFFKIEPKSKKQTLSSEDELLIRSLVIYEDEFIIALNKPSGLAVQGGTKTHQHIDRLRFALSRKKTSFAPCLVHRLDKDTSGILILAKTQKSANYISTLFKQRLIHKTYLAITKGVPKPGKGEITGFMKKRANAFDHEIMTFVDKEEKNARYSKTYYEVIDKLGQKSALLALFPVTGRTHQLRLHMNVLGTPILGDYKYGIKTDKTEQVLHLHAYQIEFKGEKGKAIRIRAPLPEHMHKTCREFNFDLCGFS